MSTDAKRALVIAVVATLVYGAWGYASYTAAPPPPAAGTATDTATR